MKPYPIRYSIIISGECVNGFDPSDLCKCIRSYIDDFISSGDMTCNVHGKAVNSSGDVFWNLKRSLYIAPMSSMEVK